MRRTEQRSRTLVKCYLKKMAELTSGSVTSALEKAVTRKLATVIRRALPSAKDDKVWSR